MMSTTVPAKRLRIYQVHCLMPGDYDNYYGRGLGQSAFNYVLLTNRLLSDERKLSKQLTDELQSARSQLADEEAELIRTRAKLQQEMYLRLTKEEKQTRAHNRRISELEVKLTDATKRLAEPSFGSADLEEALLSPSQAVAFYNAVNQATAQLAAARKTAIRAEKMARELQVRCSF
ncbi:unnamed protein product [Protopolystoma xenopodis]|uniref:Uncharacterized protein n=1 Tax=Protopolystoma xenopodis TaxID=117903 RepID=A0A448XBY7_9PLAT|nr:unnamed protein product [Protopolystoma xenopodis]